MFYFQSVELYHLVMVTICNLCTFLASLAFLLHGIDVILIQGWTYFHVLVFLWSNSILLVAYLKSTSCFFTIFPKEWIFYYALWTLSLTNQSSLLIMLIESSKVFQLCSSFQYFYSTCFSFSYKISKARLILEIQVCNFDS
jgi:hypothetical protein